MFSRSVSVLGKSTDQIPEIDGGHYKVSPYRFVIVLVYVIASNMNIFMWSVFFPLISMLRDSYDQSLSYVTFAAVTISNVSYIPANFVGNYIIDTYGLRIGTIVGASLGLIGLWIRCLSLHSFTWIFIGQIFAGVAQPYFYSTPQKFSNVWFAPHERSYATTFMSCAPLIGNAMGPLISGWFKITTVKEADFASSDLYYDYVKTHIHTMFFWMAVIGSVCFVFTTIMIREKPKVPPSRAAAAVKHDYKKSLKKLISNRNAMTMIVATAIINGNIVNYISSIQPMTEPFDYDPDTISYIISLSTFVGLVGSFVGAAILHKFKAYNLVLIGASILSLLALVGNLLAVKTKNATLFGVAVTIYSVLVAPVLPVALEYGVELAFPVAEATSGGIWFVINQGIAALETLGIDQILGDNPTEGEGSTAFYIMIGLQAIMIAPLFFVKQDLKRTKYEHEHLLGNEDKQSSLEHYQVQPVKQEQDSD